MRGKRYVDAELVSVEAPIDAGVGEMVAFPVGAELPGEPVGGFGSPPAPVRGEGR